MKTPARFSALIIVLAGALSARADVKLPAIFSDHMVLQRDARVPVWGTAASGEKVTVTFAGQSQTATAGADGKWQIALNNLRVAATPQTLTVKGNNTLTIEDVLVGEVWLGSGQSNMAMTVNRSKDFEQEQPAAKFPLIRHFKEDSPSAATAQSEGSGKWVLCAPETVGAFSAALYFFGRELHQKLNVPVGLVNSSVGGTPIESWIAVETQQGNKELQAAIASLPKTPPVATTAAPAAPTPKQPAAEKKKAAKKATPAATTSKGGPGGLFNGKIVPLVPFAIRGALWYQGEANTTPAKVALYEHQLPLLVRDWRARWGYDFPVAWVQLPNFGGPGRDWPTMREAMLKTLALPKTGMAITMDIGEEKDIHPKNKQDVGRRLALWALGDVYGQKVPATSGPLPAGHTVRGNEIVLSFKHTNQGLVAKGGELTGFVVAGADRQWKPARARIVGETVVVSSPEVNAPVAARYAWENWPTCNLFNGAGLPASPFRTDDWK